MESIIQFSIAGICLILAFLTNRFAKDPEVEKPIFEKRKLFWVILIFILSFLGISVFWNSAALLKIEYYNLLTSWQGMVPLFGMIGFIFVIQLFIEKVKPGSFGFCLPKNWGVLIPMFIFFFGISLLNLRSATKSIPLLVFAMITIETFFEEIFCRGFIQNELERMFGIKYMWIIAGILFGLWHIPTDFWGGQFLQQRSYLFSFGQLAMQTCGGIWAGAVYKKTRSLYPLILFHWIGNNYHIHLYHTLVNQF